jgi:imidazolonepropionase-like amidohydrolase
MIAAFLAAVLSLADDEPNPDPPLVIAHVEVVDLDDRRPVRDASVVILSLEVFRAIADECKAQNIPFAGHVPSSVSAREASDLGQKAFEHVYGILADCSTRRDDILAQRRALIASGKDLFALHFARQNAAFARAVDCVGRLHRSGVPILAGTDELNPYIFPWFSLHDELALLVKAGLSPREALKAATINPATFFGNEATIGTVEAAKAADLVLLDADLLADIANTTKIRAVIVPARLLDREALDRMLKAAQYSK